MRSSAMPAAALVAVVLVASSCQNVSSVNSVAGGAAPVNLAPFLGGWILVEMGGEVTGDPLPVVVESNGAGPSVTYGTGSYTETETIELADVDGAVIASIQHPNGLWDICRFVLENNGDRLALQCLDQNVVEGHVANGVIGGAVQTLGDGWKSVKLTADSQELRAYLASNPGAFSGRNALVLQKPRH